MSEPTSASARPAARPSLGTSAVLNARVPASRFFLSGLIVLGLVGFISFRAIARLASDTASVSRSHEIIATLASVDGELAKAAAARRGFTLSRDSSFVLQFSAASDRFDDLRLRLDSLVAEIPDQRQHAEQLGRFGRARLDELHTLIDAFGAARPLGRREPLPTDPLARAVRLHLLQLNAEQQRALTSQQARAERTELLADTALLGGFALSFALFGMAWRRAQRMATDQHESGRLLAERALELDVANRQLEELLFAAASRLQVPLQRLQQLAADANNVELPEVLDRVSRIVRDLRTYARLVSYQAARDRVPLGDIVESVVQSHQRYCTALGGRIDVAPLPTVLGDATLLEWTLWHLIDNALTFHRPGVPPVVRVTATFRGATAVIAVRDNGIGILRDNQARAFNLFERLEQEHYEGNGIGLPIAQRAAELMRTRITVDSTLGEGSEFAFEIPVFIHRG